MARVHVGDSRRHLPGSGEMEQDEKDPTRGLPWEPKHAWDLWETARNWVKKRVILKLWGEGRGRGGGLVNPSSPRSQAEKASVPEKPLSKETHVLAVGNWAGMPWKGQATETQAGQQLQLQHSLINSIKLNEGTGISEHPVSLGPSNNTAPS